MADYARSGRMGCDHVQPCSPVPGKKTAGLCNEGDLTHLTALTSSSSIRQLLLLSCSTRSLLRFSSPCSAPYPFLYLCVHCRPLCRYAHVCLPASPRVPLAWSSVVLTPTGSKILRPNTSGFHRSSCPTDNGRTRLSKRLLGGWPRT